MKALRKVVLATGLAALVFAPGVASADENEPFGGSQYGAAPDTDTEMEKDVRHETETEYEREEVKGIEEEEKAPRTGDVDVDVDVDQPPAMRGPMVQPAPAATYEDDDDDNLLTPFGMAISVGGGVNDFVDNDIDGLTDMGGSWDARIIAGTRSYVGLEAAYIGTAQDVDALGLDNDAVLISNGAEGLLRVNVGTYMIQPFIFGGAAWQHYSIANEDFNTSSINDDDDVFSLPFGAGLGGRIGNSGLLLDARFTYRPTFEEDLLQPGTGNETEEDLDNWNVSARIGYEF